MVHPTSHSCLGFKQFLNTGNFEKDRTNIHDFPEIKFPNSDEGIVKGHRNKSYKSSFRQLIAR